MPRTSPFLLVPFVKMWLAPVLTAVLLGSPVYANDSANYGNWTAKCEEPHEDKEGGCFIFQNLVLREGGQRVLQVAIGYVPKTTEPIALISLPLGISLPPGVSIELAKGQPTRFPVERCEPNGCRAGLKLKKDFLEALKHAKTLTVRFHDAQRQPIEVPLSLAGFAAGLEALKQKSAAAN
jgi:invasion protein IalB